MKKAIAILATMVVLVGAVFAATNDQLIINATVSAVAPIISIYGGKDSAADSDTTVIGKTSNPNVIEYTEQEVDLSSEDVVLYIRLYQSNKAKYVGTVNLKVKATPLTHKTLSVGTVSTGVPSVDHITKTTPNGITYSVNPSSSTINGETVVSYAPTYDGRAINATNLGTFDLTWPHNAELTAGVYEATITLEYTTT